MIKLAPHCDLSFQGLILALQRTSLGFIQNIKLLIQSSNYVSTCMCWHSRRADSALRLSLQTKGNLSSRYHLAVLSSSEYGFVDYTWGVICLLVGVFL